jgi:hypothetical protein
LSTKITGTTYTYSLAFAVAGVTNWVTLLVVVTVDEDVGLW